MGLEVYVLSHLNGKATLVVFPSLSRIGIRVFKYAGDTSYVSAASIHATSWNSDGPFLL